MHRQALSRMLGRYSELHPSEKACTERIQSLVADHPDCFERTCLPGHITASTWIVAAEGDRFLLTHHRKLGRWLQLGGHADGESHVEAVALREAREESGMMAFDWVLQGGELLPLDVDVHAIPERPREPGHDHHDIRFLLVARRGQPLRISPESNDLRWFAEAEVAALVPEESITRMAGKAQALLRGDPSLRGAISPEK